MRYKLTTVTDIANAGHNTEVYEFDLFDELQEHMQKQTTHMERDEEELYYYNSKIEEIE